MSLATDFYQKHLDRVSRSFAACIPQLEQPLRQYVSLTYLVCRILDSVEDARWRRLSEQMKAFQLFDDLLNDPSRVEALDVRLLNRLEGLSEGEMELLKDSKQVFRDLHSTPGPVRQAIQTMVRSMSDGMKHFAGQRSQGFLRLNGLREVNQYCFFVAGVVGETLASLLVAVDSRIPLSREFLFQAHQFGLFLQKVNLLKDQFKDEKEGRFLVPSREDLYNSLRADAQGAWGYIRSIPLEHRGYRIFCLWSLFLGLKTLPLLKQQSAEQDEPKLRREETVQLFQDLQHVVSDQWQLDKLFEAAMAQADFANLKIDTLPQEADSWFLRCYQGALERADLSRLINSAQVSI